MDLPLPRRVGHRGPDRSALSGGGKRNKNTCPTGAKVYGSVPAGSPTAIRSGGDDDFPDPIQSHVGQWAASANSVKAGKTRCKTEAALSAAGVSGNQRKRWGTSTPRFCIIPKQKTASWRAFFRLTTARFLCLLAGLFHREFWRWDWPLGRSRS